MIKKFLVLTVSVLSLQSASFAGSKDVESIVNNPTTPKQTEVVAADSAAPVKKTSKFKKFMSHCFACLRTTKDVVNETSNIVDGMVDLTGKGLQVAEQIDEVTGGKSKDNIDKAKKVVNIIDKVNDIVDETTA